MSKRLVKVFIIFITIINNLNFAASEDLNCDLSGDLLEEIRGYQVVVDQIVSEITEGRFKGKTYDALTELTDSFGPRMVCTKGLENAIDYAVEKMKEGDLENVHTEKVSGIPNWQRGKLTKQTP